MCKPADVMAFSLYEFAFVLIFNFSCIYLTLSKCPLLVKIMAVFFDQSDFYPSDIRSDCLAIKFIEFQNYRPNSINLWTCFGSLRRKKNIEMIATATFQLFSLAYFGINTLQKKLST